jgi:Protein of unknown function (DUF3429)
VRIPLSALLLGLAGLLPFLWGLGTYWLPAIHDLTMTLFGPRYVAPFVSLTYGGIILCFMSGVLWGFATRAAADTAGIFYALSVLPALWVFLLVGNGVESSARFLIAGFAGLLALDWLFWRQGLAPEWWMRLRGILTAGVVLCLAPFALT